MKKKLKLYNLFICHRDYFGSKKSIRHGGGDFLAKKIFVKDYLIYEISHDDFSVDKYFYFSLSKVLNHNQTQIIFKKKFSRKIKFFKYLLIFYNLFQYIFESKIKINICLGIDPLAAFFGNCLKIINKNTVIFHITDYSNYRYSNFILNFIYKLIFLLSLKYSNLITSPSKKLIKERKKYKILFIPNSPYFKNKIKLKNNNNNILLLTPKIDQGIDLEVFFLALVLLRKKVKTFKVFITGDFISKAFFSKYTKLIKDYKLTENIKFLGFIRNNRQIINLIKEKSKQTKKIISTKEAEEIIKGISQTKKKSTSSTEKAVFKKPKKTVKSPQNKKKIRKK